MRKIPYKYVAWLFLPLIFPVLVIVAWNFTCKQVKGRSEVYLKRLRVYLESEPVLYTDPEWAHPPLKEK